MEPDGCGYNYIDDGEQLHPFHVHIGSVCRLKQQLWLRSCDVVITTYPKCGTTWMQQL